MQYGDDLNHFHQAPRTVFHQHTCSRAGDPQPEAGVSALPWIVFALDSWVLGHKAPVLLACARKCNRLMGSQLKCQKLNLVFWWKNLELHIFHCCPSSAVKTPLLLKKCGLWMGLLHGEVLYTWHGFLSASHFKLLALCLLAFWSHVTSLANV